MSSAGSTMTDVPEDANVLVLGDDDDDELGGEPSDELPPFLWEQISSSIDAVELEEVQGIVGQSLVSSCMDIYAEVRALHEIHREYTAGTDEMVKTNASMPRATASQPAGLVQLELKSLVSQLRQRARASGVAEDALLPTPSSPQRKALESVLRDDLDAANAAPSERMRGVLGGGRPGTADSERVSLREMRLGGGASLSRPSTASLGSRPPTSSGGGSRPMTGLSVPPATSAAEPHAPAGAPGARSPRSSRPPARSGGGGGRPAPRAPRLRGQLLLRWLCRRGAPERRRGERRERRSGLVVSRLRAALEEERQALLAQAEGLRLAIDDEHDYRERVAQPPPSLTSLLELKRSLQDVLSKADSHDAALRAPPPGGERGAASSAGAGAARGSARAELSRHAPLPDVRRES